MVLVEQTTFIRELNLSMISRSNYEDKNEVLDFYFALPYSIFMLYKNYYRMINTKMIYFLYENAHESLQVSLKDHKLHKYIR